MGYSLKSNGHVERAILYRLIDVTNALVPADQDITKEDRISVTPTHTNDVMNHLHFLVDETQSRDTVRTSVNRAANRLCEKGLIEKVDSDELDDPLPRVSYWTLTEDGKQEVAKLWASYESDLNELNLQYGGDWSSKES